MPNCCSVEDAQNKEITAAKRDLAQVIADRGSGVMANRVRVCCQIFNYGINYFLTESLSTHCETRRRDAA